MKYRVAIPPNIAASVSHLHPILKGKIKEVLKLIEENPYAGKSLRGELSGLMSFRASQYRIVYRVVLEERRVEVIDIGPRKVIYERLFNQ